MQEIIIISLIATIALIINFFYGFNYWDEPAFDTINDPKSFMFQWPLTQTETNNIIKAYPNPAEEYIMFEYSIPEGYEPAELRITNLMGKNMYNIIWPGTTGIYQLDLSGWPSGVYLFSVTSKGIWLENGKFIIK